MLWPWRVHDPPLRIQSLRMTDLSPTQHPLRSGRSRCCHAAIGSVYLGGLLMVASMFMYWPSVGRRGSAPGLMLIGRIVRLSRLAGVRHGWLIGALWFLIPLCGAGVMLLTAIATRATRRVAVAAIAVVLVELALLRIVYVRVQLDPWAGGGMVAAALGAIAALVGACGSWWCRRGGDQPPSDAACSSEP